MWKTPVVILYAVVLFASLSRCEQTTASTLKEDIEPNTTIVSSSVSVTTESSQTTRTTPPSTESQIPITSEKPMEAHVPDEETAPPRRLITYDQRQDGHYNIRADLENFMIVVIPPNLSAGVNLLDLLAETALKRSNVKKAPKKHNSYSEKNGLRKLSHLFGGYLQRAQQRQNLDTPFTRTNEFIEGRTPYSVDISSSEEPLRHFSDNAQFEMDLAPPYPLNLHNSFPMEGSPTRSQGPLLELFTRFSEQRYPKAISDHHLDIKDLQTNRVSSVNDGRSHNNNFDFGKESDELSKNLFETKPHVELIDSSPLPLSGEPELNSEGQLETRSSVVLSPIDKNWELKLIGASEQCGPGRRRNSYGVCQFVPDIY